LAVVSYLPDLSVTFIVAAIVPLIIGFIVGMVIKAVFKIGIAIAILILLLLAVGVITPNQILTPLASLIKSGASSSNLTSEVTRLAGYLPWSSLTFIIGLAVGFWKG
jgi:uncharacterized membrane protein (Fun14 family)